MDLDSRCTKEELERIAIVVSKAKERKTGKAVELPKKEKKSYYERHKEERKAYQREYERKKHGYRPKEERVPKTEEERKAEVNARAKQYYQEHKEKCTEYNREYYKKNRDYYLQKSRERYQRIREERRQNA